MTRVLEAIVGGDEPGELAGLPAGLAPGSVVAGYRIEQQIGQGGMAVVYRAWDDRLQRRVALKVLAPVLAADETFRRRFIRESRAAAAVDDPHIIPVFEAGDASGVLFIAMRYVPGGDVGSLVRREGRLPVSRAAGIMSPVASALDAAHAAGLVHRDVKPGNMLVDSRTGRPDHVYLSDFGLTKGELASVGLTGSGQFLGTLDYCAPEQLEGRAVDGRADQYALACATFELLCGTPPFARDQAMAVFYAQLSEPPPALSSRLPGVPLTADAVLARAMAKAPADRYPTCREFADALRAAFGLASYDPGPGPVPAPGQPGRAIAPGQTTWLPGAAAAGAPAAGTAWPPSAGPPAAVTAAVTGPGPAHAVTARPPGGRRSRRPAIIALTAVIVLAAGSAAVLLASAPGGGSGRPAAANTPPSGAPGRGTAGTAAASATTGSSPSAGPGSPTASTGTGPDLTRYALANILNPDSQPPGLNALAFSPEGSTLVTGGRSGSCVLWDAANGNRIATLTDPASQGVLAVAFSPDGQTLAVGDGNHHVYLWNLATRTRRATLTDPASQGVLAVAFSRNGDVLASGDANHNIYLWNPANGAPLGTLTDPHSHGVDTLAFSPDGSLLAAGDFNGTTYLWNVATHAPAGGLGVPGAGGHKGITDVAFSPDGQFLATGSYNGSTYLWSVASQTVAATFPDPSTKAAVEALAFSRSGLVLATGDLNGSTYLWRVASSSLLQTLTMPGPARGAVWAVAFSPDSSVLATGDHSGGGYLWKVG